MNQNHQLCSTPEWAAHLQTDVLPYLVRDVNLGDTMLEVGPGPGAATGWLCDRVGQLVVVESDEGAADKLANSHAGTNVTVMIGDGAALVLDDGSFDAAGCFTMLHHVPTVALQNRLLSEMWRVLRPGGVLIGSDSVPSDGLHRFHDDDIYNPVEPGTFMIRLQTIGYERITVTDDGTFKFIAHKPHPD